MLNYLALEFATTPLMETKTPDDVARKKRKPSVRAISKLFGMPVMTTHLLMSTNGIKQIKIRQGLEISDCSMLVSRRGFWCKLSIEQREQIVAWIRSHPHVIFCQLPEAHCKLVIPVSEHSPTGRQCIAVQASLPLG